MLVMPSADTTEIGKPMVITRLDMIYLVRGSQARLPVFVDYLTPPSVSVTHLVPDLRPVGREGFSSLAVRPSRHGSTLLLAG